MNPTNEPMPEFTPASTEELTQLEGGLAAADTIPIFQEVSLSAAVRFFFW